MKKTATPAAPAQQTSCSRPAISLTVICKLRSAEAVCNACWKICAITTLENANTRMKSKKSTRPLPCFSTLLPALNFSGAILLSEQIAINHGGRIVGIFALIRGALCFINLECRVGGSLDQVKMRANVVIDQTMRVRESQFLSPIHCHVEDQCKAGISLFYPFDFGQLEFLRAWR